MKAFSYLIALQDVLGVCVCVCGYATMLKDKNIFRPLQSMVLLYAFGYYYFISRFVIMTVRRSIFQYVWLHHTLVDGIV